MESNKNPVSDRKICLVVGGSGGIGSEICAQLAGNDYFVAIGYHKAKRKADHLKTRLIEAGRGACCIPIDVNLESSVESAVKIIQKKWGTSPLYLVYTPGDELFYKSFTDHTWQQIQDKINIFTRGAWYCLKTLVPHMRAGNFGRIVLVNSSFSWAIPPASLADYIIGKYSQQGLMKAAAVELGVDGITVNSISPGMTQTDFIALVPEIIKKMIATQNPIRRLATPLDVANAVLFLLRDESSYLNGVDIPVAGGSVMR